jgi:DNA mismatch endonuclease (patch repair protein)
MVHIVAHGSMTNRQPTDTSPEYALRRRLHGHGLRFARALRELPGRPDIVLPKRRSVIFVQGCFWHGHDCPDGRAAPRFKVGAWAEKIAANRAQGEQQRAALRAAGWHIETVWECQIDQPGFIDQLAARLRQR